MNLIQSLKSLGLNEKEARVYIALLQTGKATAYAVAQHCGLKKPTTYVILDELVGRGFVLKLPREKTMHYVAISPDDLFSIIESKVNNAREILPELKALSKEGERQKVKVSYYEGIKSIRELYRKELKEMAGGEIIGFFGHGKNTPPALNKYWNEYNIERVKKKIKSRGIVPYDSTNKKWIENQKKYLINAKTVPLDQYDSDISIEIYKNFVQIISFRYLQGVLIDNPDIAKALRRIFEMVWNHVDENDKK